MPEEFKKYFWDTKFEELDKEKNKRYIISRLYCYGDLKILKWINDNYSFEDIEDVARKCSNNINYVNIIMGLSYFEDAEQEILPKTFVEYDWEEIKRFFISFQADFQKRLEILGV